MWTRNAELQRALGTAASRAGAAALAAVVLAGDALGQSGAAQAPVQQVDSAAGDRHALSTSLRVMSVDLSPHNFERVYQVPGRDDLMMRTNGALYAVFEQSTYARDPKQRGALRAVIPAATVFYIGRPDFRVIRGTGIRDIDFVPHRSAHAADAPGQPLASVHGVTRLEAEPLDGRIGSAHGGRVDGRIDGREAAASPTRDGRAAAADAPRGGSTGTDHPAGPVDRTVPTRPPVNVAPEPSAPPAPVVPTERPGFNDRIDELMRRARKRS
ncbi:MAG: hypothetical protein RI990_531 [Planctomycetota bacterium]